MKLSDEVECIELKGANVYLLHKDKNILIDTGLPFCRDKLILSLRNLLGENAYIDSILLTHHDVDHIGNLKAVQEIYGGVAYINSLDLPYALGQKKRPGIKHIIEKIVKSQISSNIQELSRFGNRDIKTIHMPGHTPGHTVFQYDKYLFTGDLFKIMNGHIVCMKKRMNCDNSQMADSINRLLDLDAEWICPGHGMCATFDETLKEEIKKAGKEYGRN